MAANADSDGIVDSEMNLTFWDSWFKEEPSDSFLPSLTRKQRVIGFLMLLLAGSACFGLALLLLPFLVLKVRKFAMLFTLGSLLTLGSFSVLWGPVSHMKHLFSPQRLPFTAAYVGSMALTLFSACVRHSTVLTLLFAVCEVIALIWYTVSYIPGGVTGMKFLSRLCGSVVTTTVEKGFSNV